MGLVLGRKREQETLRFPSNVAAAGDERYVVCAAGAPFVLVSCLFPHCKGGLKLLCHM